MAILNGPVKSGLMYDVRGVALNAKINLTYDCIFKASRTRMAFLRFPPESSTILLPASVGRSKPAFLETDCNTANIC